MEVRSLFDRDQRRSNVADQDSGFQDLNLFDGGDGAVDFPAVHEHTGGNNALDNCVLSHDQRAGGVDLSFDAAVNSHSPIKVDHAFEIDILREQRKIFEIGLR